MPETSNIRAPGDFKFGGQRPVSDKQKTITGTVTKKGEVSPRTNEAMDSASRSAAKRLVTPWIVKVAGLVVTAIGALATLTGMGAPAGVPLMVAGGAMFGLSSMATAADAGRYASKTGNSVARGVLKDVVISAAFPVVAAVFVIAWMNSAESAMNMFAYSGASATANQERAQNPGGDG